MQLEDYFDFETEPVERIRLKDTRIDLEIIVDFFSRGMQPDQIATSFGGPMELEKIYAAVTYYLHNRSDVDAYIARREAIGEANYRASLAKEPPEVVKRLMRIKAENATKAAVG